MDTFEWSRQQMEHCSSYSAFGSIENKISGIYYLIVDQHESCHLSRMPVVAVMYTQFVTNKCKLAKVIPRYLIICRWWQNVDECWKSCVHSCCTVMSLMYFLLQNAIYYLLSNLACRIRNHCLYWNRIFYPHLIFVLQVVFEGIVGNGIFGDIAIDDYKLMRGACPSPGKKSVHRLEEIL